MGKGPAGVQGAAVEAVAARRRGNIAAAGTIVIVLARAEVAHLKGRSRGAGKEIGRFKRVR